MSRKSKRIAPGLYESHGAYYHVHRVLRKVVWTPLGSDRDAAIAKLAQLNGEKPTGMPALITRVLEHIKPRLRPTTAAQYAVVARRLSRMLAEFEPGQVKGKDIAAIKVSLGKTPTFCNRCLSVLRVVFNHAVEWQLVESNPCIGVMRHAEKKRTRYLTDAELAAIRAKAGPRLQIIIDLLYRAGQRVSDVLKIRRTDLTEDGIMFAQGKTGTKLTVVWSPELGAAVDAAKALSGTNVVSLTLLRNRNGKTPDYRSVQLQRQDACEAAGGRGCPPARLAR